MTAEVVWGGRWEHPVCGASGDEVWDDECTASSGHDCGHDEDVAWCADWECYGCGASGGVEQFGDDTTTFSDHECPNDDEEEQQDG